MKIPKPFIPLRVESDNLHHTVHLLNRNYTFGPDGMITSIMSEGHELLAGPVRVVAREDGEDAVWDMNYPDNESESFIQSRSDEQVMICGAMQSERFIINTYYTVDYDGNIDIDFKLMTRGKTIAEVFGIAESKPTLFKLDNLWLEIPLKTETAKLYNIYPNSDIKLADGTVLPWAETTSSGVLPEQNIFLPFKALMWFGNEKRGLGWFAKNDRNWQPKSSDSAFEVIHKYNDTVVLRVHLLDSHPKSWTADYEHGAYGYAPISFHFGLNATPVKEFPKNPYIHNAFHIDCGIKIVGNYIDFFSKENRFDLSKRSPLISAKRLALLQI